jgi:hypothetical protein
MNPPDNKKGIIKEKALLDIISRKVHLKKQLIELKKEHKDTKKQEELFEDIKIIDEFLTTHRIQK